VAASMQSSMLRSAWARLTASVAYLLIVESITISSRCAVLKLACNGEAKNADELLNVRIEMAAFG